MATARPFDPRSSRAVSPSVCPTHSAIFLPPLLAEIRRVAPRIDVNVRRCTSRRRLDARTVDRDRIAEDIPKRFVDHVLERLRHRDARETPFVRDPSLDRFCKIPMW
jgi:DNA-binding transcriptional LysR family regulator